MARNKSTNENEAEEIAVSEEIHETAESETPTSSDVGKQTLTKETLGYDVTKEGVPPDEVALKTPQHPDDPSADTESEYFKGTVSQDDAS
jgi:hypothetical protein